MPNLTYMPKKIWRGTLACAPPEVYRYKTLPTATDHNSQDRQAATDHNSQDHLHSHNTLVK